MYVAVPPVLARVTELGAADVTKSCVASNVITAVPHTLICVVLQAVALTFCWPITDGNGAVYKPLALMVPSCGKRDQVTGPPFGMPVTTVVNCWVWPADKETLPGETVTTGGVSTTVAVPHRVASVWLHACTEIVCGVITGFGAV